MSTAKRSACAYCFIESRITSRNASQAGDRYASVPSTICRGLLILSFGNFKGTSSPSPSSRSMHNRGSHAIPPPSSAACFNASVLLRHITFVGMILSASSVAQTISRVPEPASRMSSGSDENDRKSIRFWVASACVPATTGRISSCRSRSTRKPAKCNGPSIKPHAKRRSATPSDTCSVLPMKTDTTILGYF